MAARKNAQIALVVILLFLILVICALLFHVDALELQDSQKQTELTEQQESPAVGEPVEQKKPEVIPEPASEPAHEPVQEPVQEQPEEPTHEPVVEPEPTPEPAPEPKPEPVEEPTAPQEVEKEPESVEEPVLAEEAARIPMAPDLDWLVMTEPYEEPEKNIYPFEEEVDWSEFVFSDQEIVLPDGTYYAQLYVNDNRYDTIEFEQRDSKPGFKKSALEMELSGTLSDEYYEQFFSYAEEYYSLEYLESVAERVSYNSNDLVLRLYFNSSQVPVQTLSMGGSGYSSLRQNYDVVGNITLQPAHFSFASNISLFLSMQYDVDNEFSWDNLNATMSFSNTFSFWNITFSMPASLTFIRSYGLIPSVGSWNAYMDFPNQNIRFSFGNVGSAGFSNGTPFGFSIEKNYGFGTGSAMSNQFSQTITLTEDSNVDIAINGNSVFNKNLNLGIYRLTDFAFVQGANDVVVTIHPLSMGEDTSADRIIRFGQNYDTSLMAKGETTWRVGMSIPRINQKMHSTPDFQDGFIIPAIPDYTRSEGWSAMENVFDLSSVSMFWEQSIGISHTYTQSHSFSFVYEKNDVDISGRSVLFGGSVTGMFATSLGTTRMTVSGTLSSANLSRTSLSVNFSQNFVSDILKPLNFSCSYSFTPDVQTASVNLGYSFSIKGVRFGISGSSSYKFPSVESSASLTDPLAVNAALSVGTNFGKHGSLSLNASLNQDLNVYATVSLSFSFSGQNISSSVSTNQFKTLTGNFGWSYRPGSNSRNSFQVNVSSLDLLSLNFKEVPSHTLSAGWARSGDVVSMSLRAQATNRYRKFTTSMSLNMALVFADGHFAMTNSIYGPFLMVSPNKGLKNATIAVSNATESTAGSSKKVFGNVLYTRLTMYKPNNIVVYASNGSLFTSSGSFLFKVTPVARQGFLAKISLESAVAISGILKQSPSVPYDSYSSPIYKVEIAENGVDVKSMEIDSSSFFFTDVDGRFILSDLKAGTYMVDLNINGQWYALFFDVPVVEEPGFVAMLRDFDASTVDLLAETTQKYNVRSFDEAYAGSLYLEMDDFITEEAYWTLLFTISDEDSNAWYDFDDFDEYDASLYKDIETSGR